MNGHEGGSGRRLGLSPPVGPGKVGGVALSSFEIRLINPSAFLLALEGGTHPRDAPAPDGRRVTLPKVSEGWGCRSGITYGWRKRRRPSFVPCYQFGWYHSFTYNPQGSLPPRTTRGAEHRTFGTVRVLRSGGIRVPRKQLPTDTTGVS